MRQIAWTTTLLTATVLVVMGLLGGVPAYGAPWLQERDTPTPTERPPATPTSTDTPIPPSPTHTNTPAAPTDTPIPPPPTATATTIPPTKSAPKTKPPSEPAAPAGAHLALGLNGSPTAPPAGAKVIYTAQITNDGGAPAEGVVVSGDVPGEMQVLGVTTAQGTAIVEGNRVTVQVGALAVGQSVAITIEAQIKDSVGAGVPMSFTVTASADGSLSAISAPVVVEIPGVPNTGAGLTALLMITGLVLAAVVLIARGLQMRRPSVH